MMASAEPSRNPASVMPLRLVAFALLVAVPQLRADVDFNKAVAPILLTHCVECHGGSAPAGNLDLTTEKGLRAGGKHGPDANYLLERVSAGEMPPAKQGRPQPLAKEQQAALKAWVASGAAWPKGRVLDWFEATSATRAGRDWWSLQPVQKSEVRGQKSEGLVDHFIGVKLTERGWEPAPEADRRTLIRRLSFDLLGLPPTFEQVEAFAKDTSPDAYEKLVEQLLASPHYGERWGRHWLDVARYAETCGYERDQVKPDIWKYRDWVVKAFNDDLPFDRFVTEQLAGDELPDRTERSLIATGFIRLGTWNDEPNDPNEYKYDRLEDMVGATSTAFLGLTVKCARCHDHKFDAIRQADYYRMAAAFWAGFIEPGPREHLGGPDPKATPGAHAWIDRGRTVPPIRLLKKGDPNRPGEIVEPGHLSTIPSLEKSLPAPSTDAKTTGRRLALAKWIVDPKNPLTARVWVNRVWQYHFGQGLVRSPDNFGFTGEKPTHPELLDWLAAELIAKKWSTKHVHRLILLSKTYRQSSLHPRQDEYAKTDAGNKLWWRAERRRVEAEVLRDTLLFAGGNLKLDRAGGPSFSPEISPEALEGLSTKSAAWKASPPAEQGRRSLYVFSKRGLLAPQLTAFDLPDATLPCGQRDTTTVAPQALVLMNNRFSHQQSESLAKRVAKAGTDEKGRIVAAWRFALSREPRANEMTAAAEHLAKQRETFAGRDADRLALESLCHVLLNTNEFLYVD
jgi:mono/diheme cytochrome c family protein